MLHKHYILTDEENLLEDQKNGSYTLRIPNGVNEKIIGLCLARAT